MSVMRLMLFLQQLLQLRDTSLHVLDAIPKHLVVSIIHSRNRQIAVSMNPAEFCSDLAYTLHAIPPADRD